MTKRLLSLVLAIVLTLSILPILSTKADAAEINAFYDRKKSLAYADAHWNDGKGLCAEFVSDCLKAGGLTESYRTRVCTLYDALLSNNYGRSYKLKIFDDSILESQNKGKIKAGDPIFYYCNRCKEFTHVSLCNGFNSAGFAIEYSHNNPHNGYKRTYTYRHCGAYDWTLYSISMYDKATVFGKKTNIDAPKIINTINVVDGIYFRWNDVSDATYYRVYRKTDNSDWLFLGNVTTPVYTDKTAKSGVEYTYTVRACKGSTFSQYYPGVTATYLNTVNFTSAENVNNSIVVKWKANPLADGYYIYRQVNNGNWYRIADIKNGKTTSYVDNNVVSGNNYRYRIRCFNGGIISSYEVGGISVKCLTAPVITVANDNNGIKVNWKMVAGADSYRVYRRGAGERYWTYLCTTSDNFYLDENVKSGSYYRYTVRSASGNVFGSYDSNGLVLRCVGTPDMEGVQYTKDGVKLSWSPIDGAMGYYVYHKAEGAKHWRRIAVLNDATSFVDKEPAANSTYLYTVKAFYGYTMSSYYQDGLKCVCDESLGVQKLPEKAPETPAEPSTEATTENVSSTAILLTSAVSDVQSAARAQRALPSDAIATMQAP